MGGMSIIPSIYHGRGLYQIHLVKADAIRPFIPKQLQLVQTFGYTMGGFYLGNYEHSSFGAFDELVLIAGIVKTAASPSCAWSAKVLVSDVGVRDYALKELGVVSEVAKFSKRWKDSGKWEHFVWEHGLMSWQFKGFDFKCLCVLPRGILLNGATGNVPTDQAPKNIRARGETKRGFLNVNGITNSTCPNKYNHIRIRTQTKDHNDADTSCNITIKTTAPDVDLNRGFVSPQMKLSFPSLSGLTEHIPLQLLKYTCQIESRVRIIPTAKISNKFISSEEISETESADAEKCLTRIVMQSKPFVAFEFNSMKMMVHSPTLINCQP